MAVLGPGGEWIKKKTNEITKGLIQQYQNFTSQSPQQTIGRLNGDGTATLPDGSIVEVVERGTPGLYCILYNMGGGKWLADLPKPRHINVDGQIDPSVYALITVFNQQADPESYIGTYSDTTRTSDIKTVFGEFTSICGLDSVWLSNLSTESVHQLDPTLYSDFSFISPNTSTYIVYNSGVTQVTEYTDICPIGPSTANIQVQNWYSSQFFDLYKGFLGPRSYTGPSFMLSTECQDILVFQANLETRSLSRTSYYDTGFRIRDITYTNIDIGGNFFYLKYKILKDIYVDQETGYIKCKSTQSGVYTIPETSLTYTAPPSVDSSGYLYDGTDTWNRANTKISLSRDEENNPELSMFIKTDCRVTSVIGTTILPDVTTTTQTRFGKRGMIIRFINSSPQIVYDANLLEEGSNPFEPNESTSSSVFRTGGYFFRGKFTGYHAKNGDIFGIYQRMSPTDFSFLEDFPYPNTSYGNVITDSAFIPQNEINFNISNFDFTYAASPALALSTSQITDFSVNDLVDFGIGVGGQVVARNNLFLGRGSFADDYIASRLTSASYCLLVPYTEPGSNPSGSISAQPKRGVAVLGISQDAKSIISAKVGGKLVDKNYLAATIESKVKYLTGSDQQFKIVPFIYVGVGMYRI